MGRRRSGRLNKTVRVLPKTAETIEAARNALGIFEGAFVDQAIAAYAAHFPALLALQEKKLT